MQRASKFEERRKHLKDLSDEQLKDRFWKLAARTVEPLVEMASTQTSPSIERSVLLRMGFSSLEAQAIVSGAEKRGLLGKGAGKIVLDYANLAGLDYKRAGEALSRGEGWEDLREVYPS